MKIHNTTGGRIFDAANYVFLSLIGIITLLPFIYVIAGSFANEAEITRRAFFVWPEQFDAALAGPEQFEEAEKARAAGNAQTV